MGVVARKRTRFQEMLVYYKATVVEYLYIDE